MSTKNDKNIKNKKRRKIKSKRPRPILSIIILCLVGISVFKFDIVIGNAGKWVGRESGNVGVVKKQSVLDDNKSHNLIVTGDNILTWGKGKLICYDEMGTAMWEKPMNNDNIMIQGNGKSFAVADYIAGDIFLLDKDGKILEKQFGLGKIGKILYTNNNELACHFPDKKRVTIFDDKLHPTANIPISDGKLMDIAISDNENFVALTFFRLSNEGYHSQIFTYQKDGRAIGARYIKGQVLLDIKASDNGIIAVTDMNVLAYDTNNELLWQKEIDRAIKKADIAKNNGMAVLNLIRAKENLNDDRHTNVLVSINKNGHISKDIPISYDIDKMKVSGERIVFSTKNKLYIMSSAGKLNSILKLKSQLEDIHIFNNGYLGIEYSDYLDIINLEG